MEGWKRGRLEESREGEGEAPAEPPVPPPNSSYTSHVSPIPRSTPPSGCHAQTRFGRARPIPPLAHGHRNVGAGPRARPRPGRLSPRVPRPNSLWACSPGAHATPAARQEPRPPVRRPAHGHRNVGAGPRARPRPGYLTLRVPRPSLFGRAALAPRPRLRLGGSLALPLHPRRMAIRNVGAGPRARPRPGCHAQTRLGVPALSAERTSTGWPAGGAGRSSIPSGL